uniref:Aspartic proteinase nepenthesin-1 n=2 Tax=Oryza TaxID=4527 RepID=C0JA44_ORYPU|nr:aspartic proteinase nepenthesin-1 precursor [Oryza punctata]ACN85232.1 aspartic proteinase nepenthesin-1 precursor [Oryza minuta]
MAAAAARCAGHGGGGGFLLRRRLLAAAAFLAAFGLGAAAAALGADADDVAAGRGHDHVMLSLEDMFPDSSSSCDAPPREHKHGATSSTTRMTIVHRHGPCSPLAAAHSKPPSHDEILAADQNRAESIQHRVSTTATSRGQPKRSRRQQPSSAPAPAASLSSSTASLPASPGRALGTGNYVVTVGLGTPASRYTVVFDTGSDTTWVQCQPCVVVCYEQREKLFDPARSSTYANVSCAAPACSDLDTRGCSGGHCLYGVQYGDGSYSIGFFAMDTLTLSSYDAVKGFRFGCGERNEGLFGEAAGLLGLGRGKTSLPVQTYDKYGGVFAHCLPARSTGTGYLDFGAGSPAARLTTTPMLVDNGPTFYYVGLTGIRVGGRLLYIPQSVFATAGTIVDSGTVITRLPPAAYSSLRSAFAAAMSARGYKKAPAVSLLDTCYDFAGMSQVAIPTVSLLFQGGARLDVDASGIMYAASASQVCLAFAANEDGGDVGIVGNTQLKTFGVAYDIGKKVVSFSPGAC